MSVAVKPVIYQLVVRYFGNTNTTNQRDGSLAVNGCGRFEDITSTALDAIRALGATHVWLTGVLRQATLTDHSAIGLPPDDPDVVKGIAGSFYAVRDYFDVCPDYAVEPTNRLAEFDALVKRVHAAGMKALIDLIPNHVARGYESRINPDFHFGDGDHTDVFFHPANHLFYVQGPPGQKLHLSRPAHWDPAGVRFDGEYEPENGEPGKPPKVTGNNAATATPSVSDWYETVKLNYGYDFVNRAGHYVPRPRLWDLMSHVVAYWQARGVDGFRCDFAHYVPAEAWAFLIQRARRRRPGAYFFAEAYPYEGSGDPVTDMGQLVAAGFDAVYHDDSYGRLKRIFQGSGTPDDYNQGLLAMSPEKRRAVVTYLENHDERRIASPIVRNCGPNDSGFGSAVAGYLLAPLQYLFGPNPVLMLNGQEVGEPGAGTSGYASENGRTTLFDYWCMPEFVKWVNGHAYDGGGLSAAQRDLRKFYADVLSLCQHACVRGEGYWGLRYYNGPDRFADCPADVYTFARFEPRGGSLLLVVANFNATGPTTAHVRVPDELAEACGLPEALSVNLCLTPAGAVQTFVTQVTRRGLAYDGFEVTLAPRTSHVYLIG